MWFRNIGVDEEVYAYLKKRGETFEDTPNSVLRRELLGSESAGWKGSKNVIGRDASVVPELPTGIPKGLRQILEVVYLVQIAGQTRSEATHLVARNYRIAPNTVIDKYCRQLGLEAFEFDALLERDSLEDLKTVLKKKYSRYAELVDDFLDGSTSSLQQQIATPRRRSILELQGLGKEIWQGIDAQEYVDRERASWSG